MLVAVLMLSLMDAGLKLLSPHYPAMQVASLRALSSQGLYLRRWSELAAHAARALPPEQRVDLLIWLRANA